MRLENTIRFHNLINCTYFKDKNNICHGENFKMTFMRRNTCARVAQTIETRRCEFSSKISPIFDSFPPLFH